MRYYILTLTVASLVFFYACNNSNQETEEPEVTEIAPAINYLEIGKDLAITTKGVLGSHLIPAVTTEGAPYALEFCNTKAIHLTDSMSIELNAKISRVSDLPRNPDNMASGTALTYINQAKELLSDGEEVKPITIEMDDHVLGYYPIMTNAFCLQCHGEPVIQVEEETLNKLTDLYPADKALGYGENELRGIWVIEMDKK